MNKLEEEYRLKKKKKISSYDIKESIPTTKENIYLYLFQ